MKGHVTELPDFPVYLSLGSNIGNRLYYLQSAVEKLKSHPKIQIQCTSHIYETEPLYIKNQGDYLNCVVQIRTDLQCKILLEKVQKIEEELGRIRNNVRFAPRTIDIDIIFYGNQIINQENLQVPHKRYSERRFVLVPLNEIAPELVCPKTHKSVKHILAICQDNSTIRLYKDQKETGFE